MRLLQSYQNSLLQLGQSSPQITQAQLPSEGAETAPEHGAGLQQRLKLVKLACRGVVLLQLADAAAQQVSQPGGTPRAGGQLVTEIAQRIMTLVQSGQRAVPA